MQTIDQAIQQVRALSVTGSESRQLAADLLDAIRAFRKQSDLQKEMDVRRSRSEKSLPICSGARHESAR